MLKLTYTEMGLHLEWLADSLEVVVEQRVILALRTGQPIHVEPSCASFLLPIDLPGLVDLQIAISQAQTDCIALTPVDSNDVEVNLRGTWLAAATSAHEGIFVTAMSEGFQPTAGHRLELLIHQLWELSQAQESLLI
ncbi:MAG: hypothetical protein JOZ78_21930 [Chroococcidiopsidaceae cyanobacterium CP_BM_ER_R8_30]|nr:hypothetical protein [Chroococcidiopsidaceae cyanobacterium CP_BM_ER_R8_30]